jgi:condensin complex subunit 3
MADRVGDVRKTLVGFLGKLNLPENNDIYTWKTKAAYQLLSSIKEKRPLSEAAPQNALTRFAAALVKNYPELEAYDEEAFRSEGAEHEETAELFGFIDDV